MKTILAAAFAVMIGLSFAGSTFADEKKMDAPAGTPAGDTVKESKTEKSETTKSETKNGKKHKKSKKTTKTEEKTQ